MNRLNKENLSEQPFPLFQPSDILNFLFVSFLLVLTLLFWDRVAHPRSLVLLYGTMLFSAFCLIRFIRSESRPILFFLRRWYLLAFVVLTFFSLGSIVHYVLPYDIDARLIEIDLALFGHHPTVFLSRFMNPYLVDLLEVCYASFYFLPVILGMMLYFKGKLREFETFALIICLGFYLSDLGNILFPARGPSQTLVALHPVPLEGKWVGGHIRMLLFALEPYRYDCFPSGHVAVTILTLALAYRFERTLFWWMLPVGSGLVFSTVYLRYHYVIDLFAGAFLAMVLVAGNGIKERVWLRLRHARLEKLPMRVYSVDKDIS